MARGLIAQPGCTRPGTIQAGTNGRGHGTVGDCLFQNPQAPDSVDRSGTRDGSSLNVRLRQVQELLSGDDLRGLSGGSNLDNGDPETLLFSMTRFFKFLTADQRQEFLGGLNEKAS